MRKSTTLLGVLALGFAITGSAKAQDVPVQNHGTSAYGSKGITRTVAEIMKNPDLNSPFGDFKRVTKWTEDAVDRSHLPQNPNALPGATFPQNPTGQGQKGDKDHGHPFTPQTPGISFDTDATGNVTPPDTFGAVGPTQIVSTTNNRVRVFNKDGSAGPLNATLNSFFSAVGGTTFGTSDPRVTYDRITQRWFVCAITVNSPNRIILGVSSGPTITSQASFTFFFVQAPNVFADYPSLGVDANALYIGENSFNTAGTAFVGTNVTVIQKTSVLGGGPIFFTRFQTAAGSGNGVYAPRGVDNDDPASTDGYIIGVDTNAYSDLVMRKVLNPGSNSPTITGNMFINIPLTNQALSVPTGGGGITVDSLDDRLFHVQMHLNRKTGKRTIYCANNIRGNSSGVGSNSGDRDVSHWYEVDPTPAAPVLVQSGTVFDSAPTGGLYCWMPSCAQTGQGHMAIGVNRANSATLVQIAAAGRLAGDSLGSTQAQTLILTSPSAYHVFASRWGDYSAVVVDPADDQTLWEFAMYSGGTVWRTEVTKLIAPPPSAVSSVVPNTANTGQSLNVTINGTAANGSEYYDTDAAYANRLACSFSGTGVTVNSITFSHGSPQQIVLNITVAGNASGGARDLTITNPDGQTVTAVAAFTVNAGQNTTVPPSTLTVNLGKVTSGDVNSLSADDGNQLNICTFLIPNQASPVIQFVVDGTTALSTLSSYSFDTRGKMTSGGSFTLTCEAFNFTSGTYDASASNTGFNTTMSTLSVPNSAAPNEYRGAGGALRGRVKVFRVGPSAIALPCAAFEFTVWTVNGS